MLGKRYLLKVVLLILIHFALSANPTLLTAKDGINSIEADGYVNASWNIHTEDSSEKVTLEVLSLPQGNSCDAYLNVYDGSNKQAPLMGRYCDKNPTLTSSGNDMFVQYVTNTGTVVSGDLNINYHQTDENGGLPGWAIVLMVLGSLGGVGGGGTFLTCFCCRVGRFNMNMKTCR
ncbi:uncharacterized protein [Argopecten irradians]|uniref:uncharacterized protein n=1 Tax=Argopecten irradians TaxID=31199 RepID=UPI003721E161